FPHTNNQSEVDAANMGGNDQVVYASWNSFIPVLSGTGFCLSTNGGVSWTGGSIMIPYPTDQGDPGPWVWPAASTWPGRLGISYIAGAGFSTDNGVTWGGHVPFTGGSSFDKNLSACDDITGSPFFGRAYTVWTYFSTNRIYISFTTNGGTTWSTGALVSPPPSAGHHHQGCDVEVGPGGTVYVIWANCTTNGQNSTEDSLGFARSTDGGVTWLGATNSAVDINGIRSANLFNGIRSNGFPRLAVDHTGGPRNGWIYVTLAEKTIAPATDVADVCLCRSTNNGTTWTHTRVNQDPPASGRYQYMPDVDVASDGSVVTSYYDQRNTTGVLTEYWISRSTDGGNAWTDVAVSDHTFTPAPIPGLAGGYQGDYTGITTAAGKFFPFWADNSSGIYQVWTDGISITPPNTSRDTTVCKNRLSKPITDFNLTLDTINFNTGASICNVLDVNVKIDTVLHTFVSDLVVRLTKGTTSIVLVNQRGGSGDNFIGTVLNDSAANPISSGTAPFTGSFRPEVPLTGLNTQQLNGNWILSIRDTASGDSGTLKAWCVTIKYDCITGSGNQNTTIPENFLLSQNYPNPFNPSTKINFELPATANVNLTIYDITGKEISVLVNGIIQAGRHEAAFDGSNLASGVYFYKIEAVETSKAQKMFTEVKKMVLIK